MNYPARLFRDLLSAWHVDASGERVEHLAADLAAAAASAPSSLCLGLMEPDAVRSVFGLVYLLDGYGLILRQRYREQKDGIFIFLDRKAEAKSEFAHVNVLEHRPEPAVFAFPKAA